MENKFYVYIHTRATDNTIFYVGKGKSKRAWVKSLRNKHWNNIVAKHGYNVVIIQNELTEEQSFIIEKELIACIGRENLCNMTDGGEGSSGIITSEETRKKLSKAKKGRKHSEEHRQRNSEARKGKKHTEEARKKMSKTRKGINKSEDHKRKVSEAQKGKKRSPDIIAKIINTKAKNRALKLQKMDQID